MLNFDRGSFLKITLVALGLLSSMATPANAQALQCTFNAAVTPTVRAEGIAELLGDIVLNCTGGVPTPAGLAVPQANITVFLSNANITSRITASPFSEALLIFDEPHSATNLAVPMIACDPMNQNLGICSIQGSPTPGSGTYDPLNGTCSITGMVTCSRPNVFQARLTGVNQVTFFGVPIDPPGNMTTRIIRITNLRANANMTGGTPSSSVPQSITASISVNPPNLLPLNNPQQTVAFVRSGLSVSIPQTVEPLVGCSGLDLPSGLTTQLNVRFDEGFSSAWKEKNIQVHLSNAPGSAAEYPADVAQDVPGAFYFSESGLLVNGFSPSPMNPPPGYGPFLTANIPFAWGRNLSAAGSANAGTRLLLRFGSIPKNTEIRVPTCVNLRAPACPSCTPAGFAMLTNTDADGGGAFEPAVGSGGWAAAPVHGNSGVAVYEIVRTDPFTVESITVPVAVVAANGKDVPASKLRGITTFGSYAPLSTVTTANDTAAIPRFAQQ